MLSTAFSKVVCLECKHDMPPEMMLTTCSRCGSNWLDAQYAYETVARLWPVALISRDRSLWRYGELLPLSEPDPVITMGEGFTALSRIYSYERIYNHPHLYAKDERQGPTSSFKDRQAALSVMAMRQMGITECVLASTGNAGVAYAAYCARAGIKLWLFLTSMVPAEKMREAAIYGAEVVKVSGTYDETKQVAAEFARRKGIHFDQGAKAIPGKESMKTLAYEIAEQLGLKLHPQQPGRWAAPDWYVQSVSGGIGPLGVWKGFGELLRMKLIDRMPKLGIIQAAGCAPMARAFQAGATEATPVIPQTLITVLATGDPGHSYTLLREAVLSNGGAMIAIEDGRTFEAMRRLASKAGFSVEPATAVAFAGLEQMLSDGTIQPDETVVVNCSGHTFTAESHILGDRRVHDLQWAHGTHPQTREGLDAAIRVLDEQVTSILVVDDNPADRRLIRRLLQRYKHYRIDEASNGQEALRLVRDHKPDLVIADLTMPELDGLALIEKLKSDPATGDIPVVIVSAKTLSEVEHKMLDEYTEAIWAKGDANMRQLVEHVARALGHELTPLAGDSQEPAGLKRLKTITGELRKVRQPVLIIEDNPQDSRLARRLLEMDGDFEVIEAVSGHEGLKAAYEHHPDLIVLDLMLPEIDGFSILQTLKADKRLRDIPVLVISAKELSQQERHQLTNYDSTLIEKASFSRHQFLYLVHDMLK
jgi:threonine synthase